MFAYLARVDVPVFIGVGGDPGYITYVSFLMNEHETTNPVVITFCRHLLLDSSMRLDNGLDGAVGAPRGPLHAGRSMRATPRWALHVGVADTFS